MALLVGGVEHIELKRITKSNASINLNHPVNFSFLLASNTSLGAISHEKTYIQGTDNSERLEFHGYPIATDGNLTLYESGS
jgi:hypothetical protein